MARKSFKNIKFIISLITVIALGLWFFSDDVGLKESADNEIISSKGDMVVTFMDVGQGDAALVELPDGKNLLIDGGNPGDGENIADYLSAKHISKLDYVVATHPHADHIGGMGYIIENMEVGSVFAPKIDPSDVPATKSYENFLQSVKDKNLKITAAKSGNTLFEGEGYKAECFSPKNDKNDGLNNYSVVFKLTHGSDSFLFTGDAEKEIEEEMIKNKLSLDSDVLKVGHHGSSSSSSKEFLNAVSPKFAVISSGRDNSYGHPHGETLKAFDTLKGFEKLYRTDVDNTITAYSNGKGNIKFTTGGITVAGE